MKEQTQTSNVKEPKPGIIEKSISYSSWTKRRVLKGETRKRPSLTLPNQAMPMQEILNRFVRGQAIPSPKEPIYNDSEELIQVSKLDWFEQQDAIRNLQEFIDKNIPPQDIENNPDQSGDKADNNKEGTVGE